MNESAACLSLVTLGVSDLAKSTAFYEALGFRRKAWDSDGVAFFEAGGVILSLWNAEELAKDDPDFLPNHQYLKELAELTKTYPLQPSASESR